MKHLQPDNSESVPVFDHQPEAVYSLEVFAGLSGVSSATILEYRELGLLPAAEEKPGNPLFDDEALLLLRRIETLRDRGRADVPVLKLLLELMAEVECLRAELRSRR